MKKANESIAISLFIISYLILVIAIDQCYSMNSLIINNQNINSINSKDTINKTNSKSIVHKFIVQKKQERSSNLIFNNNSNDSRNSNDSNDSSYFSSLREFSYQAYTWYLIKASNPKYTPDPRQDHISFIYKDKMIVIGGSDSNDNIIKETIIWEFHIKTRTWKSVVNEKLVLNSSMNSMYVIYGNFVILFGRFPKYDSEIMTLYKMDLDTVRISKLLLLSVIMLKL